MTPVASRNSALLSELDRLVSEERNPRTMEIDLQSTTDILRSINQEDRLVPEAVAKVIPEITAAVVELQNAAESLERLVNDIQRSPSGALGKPAAAEVKVKP